MEFTAYGNEVSPKINEADSDGHRSLLHFFNIIT